MVIALVFGEAFYLHKTELNSRRISSLSCRTRRTRRERESERMSRKIKLQILTVDFIFLSSLTLSLFICTLEKKTHESATPSVKWWQISMKCCFTLNQQRGLFINISYRKFICLFISRSFAFGAQSTNSLISLVYLYLFVSRFVHFPPAMMPRAKMPCDAHLTWFCRTVSIYHGKFIPYLCESV